ncbi:expressed unknown protein [Seminavis robusta]|uniref:Uncharacterized protein n=1 Tax=Seminavis robusta TaxID=568900 RepID=A0A9N8EQI6_9STRA|nr:expressed unknown protein [Seminavis robusta]|eukprot:Sro1413_g270601.1  (183) ;mRNA; r:20633-21181
MESTRPPVKFYAVIAVSKNRGSDAMHHRMLPELEPWRLPHHVVVLRKRDGKGCALRTVRLTSCEALLRIRTRQASPVRRMWCQMRAYKLGIESVRCNLFRHLSSRRQIVHVRSSRDGYRSKRTHGNTSVKFQRTCHTVIVPLRASESSPPQRGSGVELAVASFAYQTKSKRLTVATTGQREC